MGEPLHEGMPYLIGQRLQIYPTAPLLADTGNVLDPNSIVRPIFDSAIY